MPKDLFARAFHHLSRFDRAAYETEYLARLPFLMLRSAAQNFPGLAACSGFGELHDYLRTESPCHWNNPELYPHLLSLQNVSGVTARQHIHALRTHLGLRTVDQSSFCGHHLLRLHGPTPRVLELRDREIVVLEGIACGRTNRARNGRPVIYRPYPHLFDDIAGTIYVGADPQIGENNLAELAERAMRELRAYCPVLAAGFANSVGAIAFTGDDFAIGARSYNAELAYLGGIFSAIPPSNIPALVENFIHEYYHGRLWAWWLLEAPSDLPPRDVHMVSPISQETRPVVVMMQALLIYTSVIDYYQFVLSNGSRYGQSVLDAVTHRLERLQIGTTALAERLDDVLGDRPQSRRFAAVVSQVSDSADVPRARRVPRVERRGEASARVSKGRC
jgi:hypothetical protein